MLNCTRKGCNKQYSEEDNGDNACQYHPGVPVFHEGLKSWSCCSDVNKPEMEFDAFMAIQGCTTGAHTTQSPKIEKPKASSATTIQALGAGDVGDTQKSMSHLSMQSNATSSVPAPRGSPSPAPVVEEEDNLDAAVAQGTKCRRKGCGKEYVNDDVSRLGDGEGVKCVYHPAPPIFHEGSKGYLCCKRRVLEFEEFLKIEGCKTGRHVFVPKNRDADTEVLTDCRVEHYQTQSDVCVSVFAKQADQMRSKVNLDESRVDLDIYLPNSRRFRRTLNLFGPINVEDSNINFFKTKLELILRKKDNRSWNSLEETDQLHEGYNLTFGVGGRTGTIGGRELVLDEANKLRTE
ncbi:chord-domain-containing protein [Rickenella mellea]|uniref:Chord-domain-containing protein n=1 Tax=Rickenella mellea TaxID=50990 RepID=A0A4Y7QI33_9AGAM|nr:chord-domain-containing protein [Rickenella mellea]